MPKDDDALSAFDAEFLRGCGIDPASARIESVYRALPEHRLERMRRARYATSRGLVLLQLVRSIELTERALPTAQYAASLITEAYYEIVTDSIPYGAISEVAAALNELHKRDPDAGVPSSYFSDLWHHACPDGERQYRIARDITLAALRRKRPR